MWPLNHFHELDGALLQDRDKASAGGDVSLPLGELSLAWPFNRTGEPQPGLVEERDKNVDFDTDGWRKTRQGLAPLTILSLVLMC